MTGWVGITGGKDGAVIITGQDRNRGRAGGSPAAAAVAAVFSSLSRGTSAVQRERNSSTRLTWG